MSIPVARSIGGPEGPPPRTNGTPSGYRNIRVLTTCTLHFRLVAYAVLSMCTLNEYLLKVLTLATPIDPVSGLPVPASTLEPAPGHRPGQDPQGDPGAGLGPGAARTAREPAPGHQPGHGPLDSPGLGAGHGAPPSPVVPAGSSLVQALTPSSSESIPTIDAAESPTGQDRDGAEPGGHAHA